MVPHVRVARGTVGAVHVPAVDSGRTCLVHVKDHGNT
jgi:hypothetical protein